ncbi:trypsin-3, partial [Copidosoma floridanum]|uniref:trypsin-3 n=1 Tax=Copidosoma floridanum TaxID=29053 RepID=UPI000C6F805D
SEPACGQRRISPTPQSVVGRASFGAYPWQAALLDKQLVFKGSGVLLDKMHVLTAAHKVTSFKSDPGSLLVRLGEWNSLVETEIFQYYQLAATKIVIHPSYNPSTLENDVAVVKLSKAVPIVDYPNINTACKPSLPVAAGQRCYVSGWGKNLFGNKGSYQSIMKEVDVKIVDNADCENRLRQTRLGRAYNFNGISFMCAGGEVGKDACQGDGGSPLVCDDGNGQWTVYGLVAWGIGCANPGVPGVYTNVLNFLPWINNAIAQT